MIFKVISCEWCHIKARGVHRGCIHTWCPAGIGKMTTKNPVVTWFLELLDHSRDHLKSKWYNLDQISTSMLLSNAHESDLFCSYTQDVLKLMESFSLFSKRNPENGPQLVSHAPWPCKRANKLAAGGFFWRLFHGWTLQNKSKRLIKGWLQGCGFLFDFSRAWGEHLKNSKSTEVRSSAGEGRRAEVKSWQR